MHKHLDVAAGFNHCAAEFSRPGTPVRPMVQFYQLPLHGKGPGTLYFTRGELSKMLSVYSRRVSSGEWRDYAIDHDEGLAMFSVFRDTHDQPVFTIVKRGGRTDGAPEYALFSGPAPLARSSSLPEILAALEARPRLVAG
jgi:hypothetical protein